MSENKGEDKFYPGPQPHTAGQHVAACSAAFRLGRSNSGRDILVVRPTRATVLELAARSKTQEGKWRTKI